MIPTYTTSVVLPKICLAFDWPTQIKIPRTAHGYVTNLYQLTSQSTTTFHSVAYRDRRLLWRHFNGQPIYNKTAVHRNLTIISTSLMLPVTTRSLAIAFPAQPNSDFKGNNYAESRDLCKFSKNLPWLCGFTVIFLQLISVSRLCD